MTATLRQTTRLACKIAEDSAVLLKNDGILPLDEKEKLFVCGDLFEKMRYQGAGSSMINPTKLTTPKDAFDAMGVSYAFSRGYAENATTTNGALLREALEGAKQFQKVLVFAGLTDYVESEGCDREDMRLPENQLALIEGLIKENKQVIVVLFGGSPVELPFAGKVSAILNMYLPGQSGGRACANLLFGKANPAGRLAETWLLRYEDVPFGETFGKSENEIYRESVFVGYRYYTTAQKRVRYPFGFGLSYTSFAWSDMQLSEEGDRFTISCRVRNTGTRDGAEVVQLYVSAPESKVYKPLRELRAFQKVRLAAGEEKEVRLTVNKDELRYFDVQKRAWTMEGGEYRFELCSDAETVVLEQAVILEGERNAPYPEDVLKVYQDANLEVLTDEVFEKMSGKHIPPLPPRKPITLESRFSNLEKAGFMGKILHSAVLSVATKQMKEAKKLPEGKEKDNKIKGAFFLRRILESNSLISMSMSAGKTMPYNFACGFMELANGHLFKGVKSFCTTIEAPKLPKDQEEKITMAATGNALSSRFFNSKIRSQNVGGKERWLGYHDLGPCGALLITAVMGGTYPQRQYWTDVLNLGTADGAGCFLVSFPAHLQDHRRHHQLYYGWIINRTHNKQGKARPYILLSAILVPITGILMYLVPNMSEEWQAVWVMISYNLFFSFAYTIYNMSHSMMVPLSTRNSTLR